ncbi:MAG TPA: TolC family protein [Gemmatimonadaceae bacterium]|nr:TolC family protein [Gemmatimonadaceae bacterium]
MLIALWLALAAAQDTVRAPRLQLAEVYQGVRSANPRAAAARELSTAARARVASSKLPPDPEVQLGFMNYSLPGLSPMAPIGMTQLQVMQMLPLAGKLGTSGRVATAQADATAERAREVEWEVRAQAAMAFYDLHATDRALDVSRQTLRLLHDVLRTAEAMYRVGEGRQADVLRAQLEIARMVEDTLRMTTMRLGMEARLNAVLDRAADARVASPVMPDFPDTVPALSALVAESEARRPMVQAARRDVDAATAQSSLARREIWPDLTVGVQYGQRGSEMGTERMGSLMLGASIPVFAGRRQLRMREEMTAMQRMAEAELSVMRAATRSSVTEAYANLIRARNLERLYRTTILPQAEATVASAQAAYRVGGVDFMTLLDDRMTVNEYRQQLFALEAEQGKAWAELEMLLGRELFDPRTTAGDAPRGRENP